VIFRRPRSTATTAAVLALVLGVACTVSKVDPNAAITVSGKVQGADGAPLGGAKVVLVKEADLGEALVGLVAAAATLGTICLVPAAPTICAKAHRVTAGPDGAYTVHLTGRDTQGSVGNASTFHLAAQPAAGGPSVSARFSIQHDEVAVPDLKLWAPKLEVSNNRAVRAQWPPFDPTATERVVYYNGDGPQAAWVAEGKGQVSIDPRVLEDVQGKAVVESDTNVESGGTTFRVTHQSAPVDYGPYGGAPPSRGAPCLPAPCAATDGDLNPPSTPGPATQEITVELVPPQVPALVVVHGCSGDCKVETSISGNPWTLAGSSVKPYLAITPLTGPPVRFIRVRSSSSLTSLGEVSVWS
jgi:hypothetical protein